jgi:hypothetical protein
MEKYSVGTKFINERYPDIDDKNRPRPPMVERLERILHNPRATARLEKLLLDEFVIDTIDDTTVTKLAQALYESEKKIAIQQGRGNDIQKLDDTEVIEKYKKAILEKEAIQRRTLNSWFTYLKETDDYPLWFKYYVVRSLREMG